MVLKTTSIKSREVSISMSNCCTNMVWLMPPFFDLTSCKWNLGHQDTPRFFCKAAKDAGNGNYSGDPGSGHVLIQAALKIVVDTTDYRLNDALENLFRCIELPAMD